eukprot:9490276-Pyramimonas_sp.AAC.1
MLGNPGGILIPRSEQEAPAIADKEADGTVELQVEEMKAHTAKMGKWRTDCRNTISDPIFWFVVNVMNIVHGPTSRMQLAVQKANSGGSGRGQLAMLVEGGVARIYFDYSNNYFDFEWARTHSEN